MKKLCSLACLMLFPMIALAQQSGDEATQQAVTEVPSQATDTESKNLLKPANDLESWKFELTEAGKGEMKLDGDSIVFTVTETTGTNWHVQAYQVGVALKEGKQYVIKFKMQSPDAAQVLLIGQINEEDWHEFGLHEEIFPGKEFKDYEFTFTATNAKEDNNRIGFVLGTTKGTTIVKDLTLTDK